MIGKLLSIVFLFGVSVETYVILISEDVRNCGYVLTTPRIFEMGTTEKACVVFHNNYSNGTVTLKLKKKNNVTISSTSREILFGRSSCLSIKVPRTSAKKVFLSVTGFEDTKCAINLTRAVELDHRKILTFIQTDKPVYKLGQTVKIRILRVTPDLKPISEKIPAVWVESPSGGRFHQWLNVSSKGLMHLSMHDTAESKFDSRFYPEIWTIKLSDGRTIESKTYFVDNYENPKINVKLYAAPFISFNENSLTWEICAHDSFGKPVKGRAIVQVTLNGMNDLADKIIADVGFYNFTIHGCKKITDHLNLSRNLEEHEFNVVIKAEIVKNDSGQKFSSQKIVQMKQSLLLEFDNANLKPMLPFHGRARIMTHGRKPVVGELVSLRLIRTYNAQRLREENKLLKSDKQGFINFVVLPTSNAELRYHFRGASVDQYQFKGAEFKPSLWFSISDSFLQIRQPEKPLLCNRDFSFRILYNKELFNQAIYYEVVSRGNIILHNSVLHSSLSADRWIPEYRTQEYISETTFPYLDSNERNFIVHQFHIPIHITASMSPQSKLLVYYLRENHEVVSDTVNFVVEDCWENKVDLNVHVIPNISTPTAAFHLKASSHSLCGIDVIDETVDILQDDNQLTMQKVLSETTKYDIKNYSWDIIDSYCKFRKLPLNCLDVGCRLTDYYEAFDDAGLMILSDLVISSALRCRETEILQIPYHTCLLHFKKLKSESTIREMSSIRTTTKHGRSQIGIGNYSPETLIWDLFKLGKTGSLQDTITIPRTATWIASATCLSPSRGLGMSPRIAFRGIKPEQVISTELLGSRENSLIQDYMANDQPNGDEGMIIPIVSPENVTLESIIQPQDTDYDGPPVVDVIADPVIRPLSPLSTVDPSILHSTVNSNPDLDDAFLRELESQIIPAEFTGDTKSTEPILQPKETDYDGPPVEEIIADPVTVVPFRQ